MKLTLFEAFAGYGSQCMALDEIKKSHPDFDYELIGYAEIDKYAIQTHDALYPQWANRNYGDICTIDWNKVPYFDLFFYSFPCTDVSNAGQQKGLEEGSNTRSSLLWECRKPITIKRPKYLIMENVKALVGKKFLPYFHKWLKELDELGYDSYYQVMNACDYGVAQNRERIFVVSIRRDSFNERKYVFPKPTPLTKTIEDYLEEEVDEKYFLKDEQVNRFLDMIKQEDGSEV